MAKIAKYLFRAVRNGELGRNECFWIEHMDCIRFVVSLNNAFRTANQQNYAQFLAFYRHVLEDTENTHRSSEKIQSAVAFSIARSQTRSNRCHTDKTRKETAVEWL